MGAMVKDDRGMGVRVLRPRDLKRAASGEDRGRAALARHLKDAVTAETQRFNIQGLPVSLCIGLVWIVLQVVVRMSGLARLSLVSALSFWGGLVIAAVVGRELTRRRVAREVAATAVAEGICGQCCYSLEGVPVEADGCVVCPECGAAWRGERVTRPHWAAPAGVDADGAGGRAPNGLVRFFALIPPARRLIATDGRGRFVRTVDSWMRMMPAERRAQLGPEAVSRLRRAARRRGSWARALVSAPVALGAVGLLAAARAAWDPRDPVGTILLVCFALVCGLWAAGINLSHAFVHPSQIARALVAGGLCGSCTRPLAGLEPEGDGCVTCPACGAGWRCGGVAETGGERAERVVSGVE